MTRKEFDEKMKNEEIATEDILNNDFMKKYTAFSSCEEMEEEINIRAGKSKKPDINKLTQNIFREKTNFKDMEDMKKKAISFYLENN